MIRKGDKVIMHPADSVICGESKYRWYRNNDLER